MTQRPVTQAFILESYVSSLLKMSSLPVCFSFPAEYSQQLTSQLILKGARTCEFLLVLSRANLLSRVLVDYKKWQKWRQCGHVRHALGTQSKFSCWVSSWLTVDGDISAKPFPSWALICFQACQHNLVSHFRPQLFSKAHNPALMVYMDNSRDCRAYKNEPTY